MKLCLVGIEPTNKCFKMTFRLLLCTLYDVGQFSNHTMYFFVIHVLQMFLTDSSSIIIFMMLGWWLSVKLIVM